MLSRQPDGGVIEPHPMKPGNLIKTERLKRGWSQAGLAERAGVSQVAIKKIESGETVKSKFLPRIAQELEIPLSHLDPSLSPNKVPNGATKDTHDNVGGKSAASTQSLIATSNIPAYSLDEALASSRDLFGARDWPVFGTAPGSRGVVTLAMKPAYLARRPDSVFNIEESYGVIIPDETMVPELKIGWVVVVDPTRPRQVGETCIFKSAPEPDGKRRIVIRRLVRESRDFWHVEQHQPKRSSALKRSEWPDCEVTSGSHRR